VTRHTHAKDDCRVVSINENVLKETLLVMLRKQAEVFADSATATAKSKPDNSELREVQSELDRNSNFLKGLYESLVSGDITEDEYREMKRGYETKIAALTERVKQLCETARIQALESAKRAKAADSIGTVSGITDLTSEVVDALIDRILVFEDKRMEVRFKFSDEIAISNGNTPNP
jgi:hypothetical protein